MRFLALRRSLAGRGSGRAPSQQFQMHRSILSGAGVGAPAQSKDAACSCPLRRPSTTSRQKKRPGLRSGCLRSRLHLIFLAPSRSVGGCQAGANGVQRGLRAAGNAEFFQNVADVRLDSLLGDVQRTGDFQVGLALRQQA